MALYDRAIVRLLPAVPKPVVRRLSARYIAGARLDDAARVVRRLNAEGKRATVDVLGEEIGSTAEARSFADAYEEVLAEIERGSLDSTVSVKLTALGLNVDPEVCRANLEEVVRDAAARSNDVTIDMEDSSTTDATLALYRGLREGGQDNVGIVLQAALRRTAADVASVVDLRPTVRLCKGIYVEPASIAYHEYDAIRASFVRALEALLEAGCYVGIATHDEWLLRQARRLVAAMSLGPDRYEFQMLLGVRPDLGDELIAEGHALRVYVPFGEHWYAYSLRRLQENPKLAGYIASDTLARVLPRRRRATAVPPG